MVLSQHCLWLPVSRSPSPPVKWSALGLAVSLSAICLINQHFSLLRSGLVDPVQTVGPEPWDQAGQVWGAQTGLRPYTPRPPLSGHGCCRWDPAAALAPAASGSNTGGGVAHT